jgi:hypothetical protein
MKKFMALIFAAGLFASCADSETTETTDTTYTDTLAPATQSATVPVYVPVDGDVAYTGGKVQVYRSTDWEDANDDVTLSNGVIVYRDGRASREGTVVVLEDGYVVDRDGNVWDRTGNAVADAWDATKHGVKEAGKAVGKAAKKTGEAVKDAVD